MLAAGDYLYIGSLVFITTQGEYMPFSRKRTSIACTCSGISGNSSRKSVLPCSLAIIPTFVGTADELKAISARALSTELHQANG
jgi:hypothetical protein